MLGLRRDDLPPTEIWPCCWESLLVFMRLGTQWNIGPSGPVGLRYESMLPVMRLCSVPASQRESIFEDVQVLEREALTAMRESANKAAR